MSQEQTQTSPDAARWVDEFGDALFRYALARIADAQVAEELVQETFLAALGGLDHFEGRSSPLTWLIAILRRKVADHHRRAHASPGEHTLSDAAMDASFFDHRGHWKARLGAWPSDPQGELERREFWQVFHGCLSQLPGTLAEVFALRELDDCQPQDICDALEISRANLSVRLHRARVLLRRCLELKWFHR